MLIRQVRCPQCYKAISAANVNIQEMVAYCPSCQTLFALDVPIPPRTKSQPDIPDNREVVERPRWLDREHVADGIELSYDINRDSGAKNNNVTLIAGIEIFLVAIVAAAFFTGGVQGVLYAIVIITFPLHLILLVMLANLRNRSVFGINSRWVYYQQEPLALIGRRQIATKRVTSFQLITTISDDTDHTSALQPLDIHVNLSNGDRRPLLRNMRSKIARYVVHELQTELDALRNHSAGKHRLSADHDDYFQTEDEAMLEQYLLSPPDDRLS